MSSCLARAVALLEHTTGFPTALLSRNKSVRSQPFEQREEALICRLIPGEANLRLLGCQSPLRLVVPGRRLCATLRQACSDRLPPTRIWRRSASRPGSIRKLFLQRYTFTFQLRRLYAERSGDAFPHPVPAEDVTVHHIEGLIASCGSGKAPRVMVGKQA